MTENKRMEELKELAKNRKTAEISKAPNPWVQEKKEQPVIPGNMPGRFPGSRM